MSSGIRQWFWKIYHSRPGMNMKMKARDCLKLAYDWKTHMEAHNIKYSIAWRKYLQNSDLTSKNRLDIGSHKHTPLSEFHGKAVACDHTG